MSKTALKFDTFFEILKNQVPTRIGKKKGGGAKAEILRILRYFQPFSSHPYFFGLFSFFNRNSGFDR